MRNRNLWVLTGAVVMIAVVAALSIFMPQEKREVTPGATIAPAATVTPETEQPAATDMPEETAGPEETATPADAYLLVTVGGVLYEPIAIREEADYTVRRGEMENVIHVTPDSVTMKSSTCDNQDCVLQGTVTLENMTKRVLANMIICLPNEITLELHTPESLTQVLLQMAE